MQCSPSPLCAHRGCGRTRRKRSIVHTRAGCPLTTHCGHFDPCHTELMQGAALIGAGAAGLWLFCVGAFMALRPKQALRVLRLAASTRTINNVEQGLRLAVGVALVLRSPASKLPQLFEAGGWFIILSSLVLLVLPLRWHAAYAIWWSERLTPWMVRLIAPFSSAAGIGLAYAAT